VNADTFAALALKILHHDVDNLPKGESHLRTTIEPQQFLHPSLLAAAGHRDHDRRATWYVPGPRRSCGTRCAIQAVHATQRFRWWPGSERTCSLGRRLGLARPWIRRSSLTGWVVVRSFPLRRERVTGTLALACLAALQTGIPGKMEHFADACRADVLNSRSIGRHLSGGKYGCT